MKHIVNVIALIALMLLGSASAPAQEINHATSTDQAFVSVGRVRPIMDGAALPHPYHLEARHWPAGCAGSKILFDSLNTLPREGSVEDQIGCGHKFYEYDGENLTTSAGVDANSKQMSDTAAQPASCNYVALTNTAITPVVGDTTLSGEISTNGLGRVKGTFMNSSAAIGAPPTPNTPTTVGTTGAATLYYWVFGCTFQGCTAVGSSSNLTTANATLTTGNYVSVTWTGKVGVGWYVVIRTQGSGAPSGAIAGGSSQATTGQVQNQPFCIVAAAGTAPTCTVYDQSNNTNAGQFGVNGTSTTVPSSDQTYVGKHTITNTFTATGTQSAQAFGVLNAASNGTMCWEGTFTQASLVNNDTLAFTETVYH
jgi:hypothetical protein